MNFEIETYKGQTIEYDDECDKFICDISIEDKHKITKRLSLGDVRKEIDTFIKLNADFKPFKVLELDYSDRDFNVLQVSGIRTDGKFITHPVGNERSKSYRDKKDMAKWRLYDSEVVNKKKELRAELDKVTEKYRKELIELTRTLTPIDLSKYEHIINAE